MKYFAMGLLFAALWASASVATKIGLQSVQPLVLANVRFIVAGLIMMAYAYISGKKIDISYKELKQLSIYGFLNVTLYLGAYVYAIKYVSAGIGSLATAANPLFISILSGMVLQKAPSRQVWVGVLLGMGGILLATYPLILQSYASGLGLSILFISMLSYSVATIYFSSQSWVLQRLVINAWQVLIGGIILLPITLYTSHYNLNSFDSRFYISVAWLVLPVSIVAVTLWLKLLDIDPVKASIWLFLCPIFGFIYAFILLNEPLSWHTYGGTLLVLLGLFLGQKPKK
jgi:probable blue pigment (indigoidine) exporter